MRKPLPGSMYKSTEVTDKTMGFTSSILFQACVSYDEHKRPIDVRKAIAATAAVSRRKERST